MPHKKWDDIKRMSRNEAAERLRADLPYVTEPANERYLSLLDEAIATERRLTVERVREAAVVAFVGHAGHTEGRELVVLSHILDNLATADAKEEGK